jgi:hypothetical protein
LPSNSRLSVEEIPQSLRNNNSYIVKGFEKHKPTFFQSESEGEKHFTTHVRREKIGIDFKLIKKVFLSLHIIAAYHQLP